MADELVLVTGGSGFIGVHCILQLLDGGYRVRTTVRSSKKESEVKEMLQAGGCTNFEKLEFAIADLLKDDGWPEAVKDCKYVLHVASPFPAANPKHEDELIVPAREGTLRALKFARDAKVKRVVVTSSYAAIGYSEDADGKTLTEKDWSNPDFSGISPYAKSKTIAERAAWDFVKNEGGSLELAVVNPVGVFGPVFGKDYSTSILIVERTMNGSVPGCPQLLFGAVDVRDVADLHLRAMVDSKANGERFLCTSGDFLSFQQICLTLRERMGKNGKKVPTRVLPNFLLRLMSLFDSEVALIVPELGKKKNGSNAKAKEMLGWNPRSPEDAIVATAESLIKVGVLKSFA